MNKKRLNTKGIIMGVGALVLVLGIVYKLLLPEEEITYGTSSITEEDKENQ